MVKMEINPNLELLMDKLFDHEDIMNQIMVTDDVMELYRLCQKIQGGYTFEEFMDFFESLIYICLDEAKDLKEYLERNAGKIGKLSEKELKDISGGVSGVHKFTASVLASLVFLTGSGASRAHDADSAGAGKVQLRDANPGENPSGDDINKILMDVSKEKSAVELSTGQKIANWFNKAADYVWDNKGAILGSAIALAAVGGLLVYDSKKIGESFKNLAERHNKMEELERQQKFLLDIAHKSELKLSEDDKDKEWKVQLWKESVSGHHIHRHRDGSITMTGKVNQKAHGRAITGVGEQIKLVENQGIIKTLTEKLLLGSAIVTVAGGIGKGLSELTGFLSRIAQTAQDINTIKYYWQEGQKNVVAWRNAINIELQKQEAKNYDPDEAEDNLRVIFEQLIHGQEEAKYQIMSFFIQFVGERKAAAMGATSSDLPAPRVLVFNGPSGTGKTFMAELLSAGITSIDPYVITANDILKTSRGDPATMPYAFFYGNTQNGGNSKDDSSAKNNVMSFLQATQGSVRVVIVDEWDKTYVKGAGGIWPEKSPLDEQIRAILDNNTTDFNGQKVDLNGAVFIFTTNETIASLQGRVQVDPMTGTFVEALVDENGDPVLDDEREQVFGKAKTDASRTQTVVPHDGSVMARLSGSICYFDKLTVDDYEIIARDALSDDRTIKTVDDLPKAARLDKISLVKRLTLNIGGVIISDKGYRLIAKYASTMPNAARSIVGAGGNKTGSVCGNLDTAVSEYVAYLKNIRKSSKGIVLLAEPREAKDSTGRKTIKFDIKPLGYEDDQHTYEQYLEECNKDK